MYLKDINLQNFRNLQSAEFTFPPGFCVVLGANGQGKSNLLEAVALLCTGRSVRAERDRELIRFGESWFRVAGTVCREVRAGADLAVRVTPEGKNLLLSGQTSVRLARYMREAACVTFASDDLEIVYGEPSIRRDFLNEAAPQTSTGYLQDLSRHRRALEQKNRVLKDVRERLSPPQALDLWDAQLADSGGRVCARRARFVRQIAPMASEMYTMLSGGAEELVVSYEATVPAPETPEQWPLALAEAMRARRQDEIVRGVSLVGPQRDDLLFSIGGSAARQYASRGQARTAALALRLAQARLAKALTGEWPVLVMDDVFAELDVERRALLAKAACEAEQVFAAAAAESDLPDLNPPPACCMRVVAGAVLKE